MFFPVSAVNPPESPNQHPCRWEESPGWLVKTSTPRARRSFRGSSHCQAQPSPIRSRLSILETETLVAELVRYRSSITISRNAIGRGSALINAVANKDIEPETILFTIPRKGIINVQTSDLPARLPVIFDLGRAETEAEDEDESIPPLDSWSSLILIMIYEFLKGEDSLWKPYFDVLPETFDTPMFWSDEELDELQASSVRDKIGKDEAESMFFSHIIPVIRKNSDLFPSSLDMADDQLIALAHRMGSTIMSYAFDLENDDEPEDDNEEWVEDRDGKSMMGMVPMADILNADAEFNVSCVNATYRNLMLTQLGPRQPR